MTNEYWMKSVLGLSGAVMAVVGAFVLFEPVALFGLSGVTLARDASLLSEVRAPGAALLALAGFVLASIWRRGWRVPALALSVGLYFAYAAGRLYSMVVDGLPDGALIAATGVELFIGAICLAMLYCQRRVV